MFYKVYQNLSCMHICMYACVHVCIYEQKDELFLGLWCSGKNPINYRILPKWWKTPEYSNENEYSIRAEMIISIFCLHFFRGRPGDFLCSAWRRWCNIMAQGGQLWPQTYKNWKGKHKKSSNKTQKMKDSCGSIWKLSHARHHRPSAPKTDQISDKVQLLGIKYQTAIFRNWRQIEMK